MGTIEQTAVFWHLDIDRSRAKADEAKGPRSVVIESFGKVWLLSIESEGWRPSLKGEHIAKIGPLPVTAGEQYSALFMESISIPGKPSPVHTHPGPEAWYTLAGKTCLETPGGILVGSSGEPVIVPGGQPMLLTTVGTEQRRALTLILYESSKPPATSIQGWTPKGLCNAL